MINNFFILISFFYFNYFFFLFFIYLFLIYKNTNWILSEQLEKLQKETCERYQNHFEEKKRKTKSVDILMKGIKIFLKKKTKNISIVVNIIKIFLKMTNKS